MDEKIEIRNDPSLIDFRSEITETGQRYYIHIPARYIKYNQVDPSKIYRVILIPIKDSDIKNKEMKKENI